MAGQHEIRLRAAVAGVRDADVLSEMAEGWRTAISRIKVSEKHLERVLSGLEDRDQLGPRTREAAAASLTEMADHLREQRRVLGGTARALDAASDAMSRAVRLIESWERAGALVDPGPAPQPDPLAKPGDDQSAYLAALSDHSSRAAVYTDAVAQREDAARREMENLEQVFARAEDKIRVHHDIPAGRLTEEQQAELRRREEERRRLEAEEEERRRREAEEERRRREEEERRRREAEDERRRREEEERRRREEERERDPGRSSRPPFELPQRTGDSSTPAPSHTGTSHLAGSSGSALITSVSAEAQSGVALSSPASSAGAGSFASATGAPTGMPAAPGGLFSGVSFSGGPLASAPSAGTAASAGASRVTGSGAGAPASSAATRAAGGRGAGTGASTPGPGRSGRRGNRDEETRRRQDLMASDSDWFDEDDAAPGVLG